MKLTTIDTANIELVTICKKVHVSKNDASGKMKKRMKSFWKLSQAEIFWYSLEDDGSVTFELV